jgi:pimeloyl-ACP methyl ester carboxylesterase
MDGNLGRIDSVLGALVLLCAACSSPTEASSPAVERGYAPVNGLNLYYEVHGPARDPRPPLVLLHGGGSTIETSFGALLPELSAHRRVIAFEQQGHGRTADVDRPFSFEQSAEDTVALLRHLGIGKADLFGYSNGGHIAIQVALSHPEVVRKLVIESAMFDRDGSDPAFWEQFQHAKLEEMPAELRDAYLAVAPRKQDLVRMFEKCVQRMAQFKGWSAEQIRSIRAPTLVLAGDHDVVRPEHAVATFRLIPNSQLAILPGTDHMEIPKRAPWVVPMVERFLDEEAGPAR